MYFNGTLLEPQKPSAEKLMNRKRMLLAWEQGTGKTIISLAAVAKLLQTRHITSVIVLAPSSLTWQWEDRIHEFTPTIPVKRARRTSKKSRVYDPVNGGIYVVPYSLFRRDYEKIVKQYKGLGNKLVVIADEAQEFSNFRTQLAQKMKRFNVEIKPKWRWALTGTAISNSLQELYSIMYWVEPKFLPPWPKFAENHVVLGQFDEIKSYKNLDVLHAYLAAGRMDRKTAKDMDGHMPEIIYEVITIPRSKDYVAAEKALLEALDDFVGNITFDEEGNPNLPENHPVRKAFAACKGTLWTDERAKYVKAWTQDRLSEGHQVVLFSSTKQPLYELNATLPTSSTLFTGDQSSEGKKRAVHEFKSGTARVLLCSDAGNAGLDLPEARYLGNINTPLSYGASDQRDKRIARISSQFPFVVVTSFVMEGFEMYFYQATKNKGKLAGAALDGQGDAVQMRPQSLRNYLKEQDE